MYDQLGYQLAKVALQKKAVFGWLRRAGRWIKNKVRPSPPPPPSKSQKLKKFLSKHKLAIGLGAGAAGIGGLYYLKRKRNKE
jgi:hypothetical protein